MEHRKIGFAFCGSFCTYSQAMEVLERVQSRYGDVLPIVSEAGAATDTRFGAAHDFMREMERICGRRVVDSIAKAEPIGPRHLRDVLVNFNSQLATQAQSMMSTHNKVFVQSIQMATIIITMLPILCVYPFVQKYFVKGVLVGSVKE